MASRHRKLSTGSRPLEDGALTIAGLAKELLSKSRGAYGGEAVTRAALDLLKIWRSTTKLRSWAGGSFVSPPSKSARAKRKRS